MSQSGKAVCSSRTGPILMALAFLVTAIVLMVASFGEASHTGSVRHDIGSTTYPRILLLMMMGLAGIVIMQTWRLPATPTSLSGWLRVVGLVVITVAYISAIPLIGFVLATIPFLILVPWMTGYRRFGVTAMVAIIYTVGVWWLFEHVLYIILPTSPWFSF